MNISLYYLLLTLISPHIICRWTQDEKEDNDSCKEDMTLTDQDGNEHCFEKESDEEVNVKCVEDDDEETVTPGECPCGPLHESLESQFNADDSERIVGGGFAKEHAHPWQVRLNMYEDIACAKALADTYEQDFAANGLTTELKFIQEGIKKMGSAADCGGSIVSVRHVITAAHCIEGYKFAKDINIMISNAEFGKNLENNILDTFGNIFTRFLFELQLDKIKGVISRKTGFKRIYRKEDVFVRVGIHQVPTIKTMDDLKRNALTVSNIKYHEKFIDSVEDIYNPDPRKKRFMGYDFAILTLTNALKFTDKIQPVCLPHTETDMFVNRIAITSGWGLTETGQLSTTLKEARMKVMSNDDCTAEQKKYEEKNGERREIEITEYRIFG